MHSRELLDKEVVGSNGWKIGKSKEIIIDSNTWRITQLDVELNDSIQKEMSDAKPLQRTRVPIDISYVQGVGDFITLKATKEEMISVFANFAKSQQQQHHEAPEKGPIVV